MLSIGTSSSVTSAKDSRFSSKVGVNTSLRGSVAGEWCDWGDSDCKPVRGDCFSGDKPREVFEDEAGMDLNELLEGFEWSMGRSGVGRVPVPLSHMAAAALTRLGDFCDVRDVYELVGVAVETSTSSNDSSSSSSSSAALMAISVGEGGLVMM